MKKLQLNKKTVSQLDRNQMKSINGGLNIDVCFSSCPNVGTKKSKSCCGSKCTKELLAFE